MAVIISEKEAAQVLTSLGHLFDALCSQRRNIGKYAAQLEAQGNTAATVATAINAMLVDWDSLRDQFVTELSAVPTTYQSVVRIGMPAMYNSANIEATNQSNTNDLSQACGIIRADSICEMNLISPFSVFASGDVVSISNAEDSSNNISAEVQRTPATASAEKITNGDFSNTIPATGWTEAVGTIAISTGQAAFTAATTGQTLKQTQADMVGGGWTTSTVYLVTFTLASVSAGTLGVGTNGNVQHTVTDRKSVV